jgi:DNA-3-methyladenine glycosylase I
MPFTKSVQTTAVLTACLSESISANVNMPTKTIQRCSWALGSELEQHYHDTEWGIPLHDDNILFEMLTLEGAQAGLSWSTILKKRENYRRLFDGFAVEKIANYDKHKIESLLTNPGIIRNRLKVESTVTNARALIEIQNEFGSFDAFIWQFTDGKPIVNHWRRVDDVPSSTALSDELSKQLKKRGFRFVGTTICYAYMQATGMVNDHIVDCFRYQQC